MMNTVGTVPGNLPRDELGGLLHARGGRLPSDQVDFLLPASVKGTAGRGPHDSSGGAPATRPLHGYLEEKPNVARASSRAITTSGPGCPAWRQLRGHRPGSGPPPCGFGGGFLPRPASGFWLLVVRNEAPMAVTIGAPCGPRIRVARSGGRRLWNHVRRGRVEVKSDNANGAELIGVLNQFCSGFARRDPEAAVRVCARDLDLVVVTSEETLLRGPTELRRFLDHYIESETTYSWAWDRYDVSTSGSVAWLLAEGTEIAASEDHVVRHPYRMTMVLERQEGQWLLRQVHGSSPH